MSLSDYLVVPLAHQGLLRSVQPVDVVQLQLQSGPQHCVQLFGENIAVVALEPKSSVNWCMYIFAAIYYLQF